MTTWDHETDVLVVGSGGGGMTAAMIANDIGCDAVIIEKGPLYGGSTAMSGGAIWVPCNLHFEGLTWWKVGLRFKGNSTLWRTWQQGRTKLPFKFDFDEFENQYPSMKWKKLFEKERVNPHDRIGHEHPGEIPHSG